MRHSAIVVVVLSSGLAAGLAQADIVTSWNQELLSSVAAAPAVPPPQASRAMAMVSAAVYDAVNSVDGGHLPYRFYNHSPNASAQAAAAQAAHSVLSNLFPARQAIYNTKLAADLAAIADGPAKTQGIALGLGAGAAINAARAGDGWNATSTYAPTNPPVIGRWQPTPPAGAAALVPQWGSVTPFALTSSTQFPVAPPPAVNSPAYTASYTQVKALGAATGSTRTQDQTDIARAWAFGGGTVTPPGAWNQIAQQLSSGNSVAENARLFAMLNVASADAAIACWEAKFSYDMWRPITAIRQGDADGNNDTTGDAGWTSLLGTPNFPTYTSGHSTFSRAAATILADFFGTDAINITFAGDNGVMRTLTSLDAAANEAGLSRIYGGIHFDFDNTAGQQCGLAVGNWVIGNYFQIPAPGAGAGLVAAGLVTLSRRRRR